MPTGHYGVHQVGIHLGVTNEADFDRFYGEVLGAEKLAPRRYRIGKTVLSFELDPKARRTDRSDPRSPAEVMASMRAVGFRYMTIQVRDCNATFKQFMANGVREGSKPVTLGEVARICFIRDPRWQLDRNLSARVFDRPRAQGLSCGSVRLRLLFEQLQHQRREIEL